MTVTDYPTQPQVAPTPVGRQLPIPDDMLGQLQTDLTDLLGQWANRLSGVELALGETGTEDTQRWVTALMTVTEAAKAFTSARQTSLAQLAKRLGVNDARRGEAVGLTEEAARRRALRGTQK